MAKYVGLDCIQQEPVEKQIIDRITTSVRELITAARLNEPSHRSQEQQVVFQPFRGKGAASPGTIILSEYIDGVLIDGVSELVCGEVPPTHNL
ncbi:hypothetical protein D3C87_1792950 [compost metagenome]